MVILVLIMAVASTTAAQDKLLTVAESSNYTATSTYNEVMDFIQALQQRTPDLRVEHLCTSTEGRWIPLLVIGDPIPAAPRDLKRDKRGVLYIQANIHAGEIEGKEACLMLVRDILADPAKPYLDDLVILVAPIFNADGNDRISKNNRRNQKGPEGGVGIRYNGQNLDLNRDAMKMESPEVQGLIKTVLNKWDPFILIDCHTTNGSYHIEPVTYVWGLNPNTGPSIMAHMREQMMPAIQKNLKKKHKVLAIPYGNFMSYQDPLKGWSPAGPQPRYITNYIGLRNRLAILLENYAYADYKTRVLGCYAFLKETIAYCAENIDLIKGLVQEADRETVIRGLKGSETDSLIIEYDVRPWDKKISIIGYEMKVTPRQGGRPRVERTDKTKKYTLPYYCNYISKRSIRYPVGYFITLRDPEIESLLVDHGIVTEKLTAPVTVEVEAFQVEELKSRERPYQGHHMNTIKGQYKTVEKTFPEGTRFVSTAQPLGTLAAYLLEAESDDGMVVWNVLDRYLVPQWRRRYLDYPIYRLLKPVALVKQTVN
jgi:hypothetical protein